MAGITRFKITGNERVGNGAITTGQSVDRGTLCAFDTDGKVRELNDTAGWHFAGIAKHAAGGTDEPTVVELDYGSPFFYANASAAASDAGSPVFASGLGTLAKTAANGVYAGIVCDVEVGTGWWIDPLYPQTTGLLYAAKGQATTGTSGDAGKVTVTGLTASGVVLCTGAESGANVSYVAASSGYFTVFDSTGTEVSGKKVNYVVLSL